jgi:tRNA threonylcarbamoyladenosine biosynthesis protein TsaE
MEPQKTRHHIKLPEISEFVKKFVTTLRGGEILALIGSLGAGKTTFTQALGKALSVKRSITSPTFVIMQEYTGTLPYNKKTVTLHHLDIYRSETFTEVVSVGLQEFWGQPDTITVIEWADKIKRHLPAKTIYIYFE